MNESVQLAAIPVNPVAAAHHKDADSVPKVIVVPDIVPTLTNTPFVVILYPAANLPSAILTIPQLTRAVAAVPFTCTSVPTVRTVPESVAAATSTLVLLVLKINAS